MRVGASVERIVVPVRTVLRGGSPDTGLPLLPVRARRSALSGPAEVWPLRRLGASGGGVSCPSGIRRNRRGGTSDRTYVCELFRRALRVGKGVPASG